MVFGSTPSLHRRRRRGELAFAGLDVSESGMSDWTDWKAKLDRLKDDASSVVSASGLAKKKTTMALVLAGVGIAALLIFKLVAGR